MKLKSVIHCLVTLMLLGFSTSSLAIDCARITTVTENTVCSTPHLVWLDNLFNNAWREAMLAPQENTHRDMNPWRLARNACASKTCLLQAYLQGISQLFNANRPFDWHGEWWNSTAMNGNGGKIAIRNTTHWGFNMDATIWGGAYKANLRGDARMYYGVAYIDNIAWGDNCVIVLIPRAEGKLEVSSDSRGSCKLLTPDGIAIDGVYVKSDSDPRPAATLLSVGVLPDKALDDRFRELTGKEYADWVATANNVIYGEDLDNIDATVMQLSVKGKANTRSAIVMFTPQGKLWAMRTLPDKGNGVRIQYVTTEKHEKSELKTLTHWRMLFSDR